MKKEPILKAYEAARAEYAQLGVNTEDALNLLDNINISLHCWQADDVAGFETPDAELGGGGIAVTGNYPGKARTISQLRADIEKVMTLLPGKQRFNLHAIYGDFGGEKIDRNQIEAKHFQSWIDWAKNLGIVLDFNCTCFSHPYSNDGYTLASKDPKIRKFWIEHVIRCRRIGAEMGIQLGAPCIHNLWIPDGSKDIPVDRYTHRILLKESLDEIYSEKFPVEFLKDAIECKLFGIGSESMVVGSHEFYMGYAIRNNLLLTLDSGHFHPTEQVGDKISSLLLYVDEILLHVSRGVRWDSDHVVILNDEIELITQEIVRCYALNRVNVSLDYFDGSINRIGAYVIGVRATQQAFLKALLEPNELIKKAEESGDYFKRLAMLEIMKSKPFGAVYDYYCLKNNVSVGQEFITEIEQYEDAVLRTR